MAAPPILPVHQRFVNGVPVPQTRKTLRLREKYIIILIFVTFGVVCFGAFFFLPDLRDRVNMVEMKKQLQNAGEDIFFMGNEHVDSKLKMGKIMRHDADVVDVDRHGIDDRVRLMGKVEEEWERQKLMEAMGKRLNMSKGEALKFRNKIDEDKQRVLEEKRVEEEKKKLLEEKQKKVLTEPVKPVISASDIRGTEPTDPSVKEKRDKIREVCIS